jgi:hypothetical protein
MLTEDDLFTAAGDLSGDNHSQNVIKLTGVLGGLSGQTDVLKYNASGTDGSYIQFDKNVGVSSGGGIVIEDSTTNVTAASLKLSAQNTTALLSTGGSVDITSGYGTLNYGEIRFGISGSSNNLVIQQVPDTLTNLVFADNVVSTLNQASSSLHDGYDFTIAAQNAAGFTGGNLILQSGTGTVDGYLSLQTGTSGFEQARIITDKLCMVTGQRVNIFNLYDPTLTISDGYFIIAVDSSVATTINLPASPTLGDYYQIKDKIGNASVNNITVLGNGNLIDGLPSYLLDLDYCSIPLVFNGTGWNIF